jgi:protein-S-isoprenylcysteine O-methyltransferase Ste14
MTAKKRTAQPASKGKANAEVDVLSPVRAQSEGLPPSATSPLAAFCGVLTFFVCGWLISQQRPFTNVAYDSLLLIGCVALGIAVPDLWLRKPWHTELRAVSGSLSRTGVKFVGLLASLGFIALLYWLFPEYNSGSAFYAPFFDLLRLLVPALLVLALPYLYWVDGRMQQPQDGLWQMGRLVLAFGKGSTPSVVGQHLLGWLVKGYFLPLMFCYMCADTLRFYNYNFAGIVSFATSWDFLFFFIFYIDVVFGTMGYLLTLRLFDTHIRSTEPTMLGWLVAVMCYEPFWNLLGRQYMSYESSTSWGQWLWDMPVAYAVWGSTILLLNSIYVWSTVVFGLRFSNLTHRGIITSGPYRFTKHPAYIAKCLSYWLVSVPFLVTESVGATIRHCLLLLMVNAIYYLRAKTEERHLSLDPNYVSYARWIDAHGCLRWLPRVPWVRALE